MRIVVKVGTSTLAHSTGRLNIRHTEELVKVLSDLKNAGHEVILVSSGAIGMGVGKLSLSARPTDMSSKQACAAVGQCELMYTYDRLFSAYDHTVAQILLTGVDIEHASRRENIQNTLARLLELGALPIINENDTVATDEITSIGDNDTLAAIVTCCIKADLLVLLSDYPDTFVMLDSKQYSLRNYQKTVEDYADYIELAEAAGVPDVMRQVIPEIYNQAMFAGTALLYDFPGYIYSLWQEYSIKELTEIAAFCREKNIQAATVYYKYWSEDVQKIFDKKGIRLYIYTVNDLKEAQYYMQEGAAGVCSDYLQDTMFN